MKTVLKVWAEGVSRPIVVSGSVEHVAAVYDLICKQYRVVSSSAHVEEAR